MSFILFLPLAPKGFEKKWGFGGEEKLLKKFFLSPKINLTCFPAEPCTRRNGTLFSRAVLCVLFHCSQHLTSHGDKSTGENKEVCKPQDNFIQAPINNCRSQSMDITN